MDTTTEDPTTDDPGPVDDVEEVEEVDVVVVGLGPGGETVAGLLGQAGVDVVGVEDRLVGGECPFYGCVPSKIMLAEARRLAEAGRVGQGCGQADVVPDFTRVARRIREEATHDWDDAEFVERLTDNGARLVRGRGRLVGERTVEVALHGGGTRTLRARVGVVLATGTEPAVPPVDGLAQTPYWTNQEVVRATEAPASMVVMGGGPIGAELAQAFARFGTEVTLVEGADRLLSGEEPEAGPLLRAALEADGVDVRLGAHVAGVGHDGEAFTVCTDDGRRVRAERLLVATGRRTRVDVGLEAAGVEVPESGLLATDERMRVDGAAGLWAVGDLTGEGAYTHVATVQARVAVRALLGQDGPWADHHAVPRVTYTDPEVAGVGLTEEQARERGLDVAVATGDLGARGWLERTDGVVKLVADRARGVLVGGTVVGPGAGEVLAMLVVAVQHRIPVADLTRTVFAYPTWHRAVETVLHDLDL